MQSHTEYDETNESRKISYISPASSSSSQLLPEEETFSSNTRRRDVRRNYAGISPTTRRRPQQHQQHNGGEGGAHVIAVPQSESIYLEIEKQRHDHNNHSTSRRRPRDESSSTSAVAEPSPSRSPAYSSRRGTIKKVPSGEGGGEGETRRKTSGYRGPFDSEAAEKRGYKKSLAAYDYQTMHATAHHRQRDEQQVFRDDADTSSVMTGLSQQELIRKKAREESHKRRQRKHFAKTSSPSSSSKKKKPIVQLPANLLAGTAPKRLLIVSPPRVHYALPDANNSSCDSSPLLDVPSATKEKTPSSSILRYRWNKSNILGSRASSEEEGSTAETTTASGEQQHAAVVVQPQQPVSQQSRDRSTADVPSTPTASKQQQQRSVPSPKKKKPEHPSVSIRGDDTLMLVEKLNSSLDNPSLGEESFPLLSKDAAMGNKILKDDDESGNNITGGGDDDDDDDDQQEAKTGVRSSDNDASRVSSLSSTTARRGVRFAGKIAHTAQYSIPGNNDGEDDESEIPWDERSSLGTLQEKERSPTSVSDSIVAAEKRQEKPKSILRPSRFKASRGILRYYDRERLMVAGPERDGRGLPPRPGDFQLSKAEPHEPALSEEEEEEEDSTLEPRAVVECNKKDSISKRLDPYLEQTEQENSKTGHVTYYSPEVPAPREGTGFTDKDTMSELSSIEPNDSVELITMPPASHLMGHPAEKHLRQRMATLRGMRGSEIPERIVEEEETYPDPPVEISMDDDDTEYSAYAFIETVAAIVVQTAVRRFLARRLWAQHLRSSKDFSTDDDISIEGSIESDSRHQVEVPEVHQVKEERPEFKAERDDEDAETSEDIALESREEAGSKESSEDFPLFPPEVDIQVCRAEIEQMQEPIEPQFVEDKLENNQVDRSLDETASNMQNIHDLAAVLIQSVFRGFWVRDCLDIDHYCATVIQKSARGFACRNKYRMTLNNIIVVQSWCRRNIARDEAANLLAYVIVIQAVFRGHRVRRVVKKYRARKTRAALRRVVKAATIIQTQWRAFVCETNFIRTLVDVLIVQTVVRRWLAQRQTALVRKRLQASKRLRSLRQQSLAKQLKEGKDLQREEPRPHKSRTIKQKDRKLSRHVKSTDPEAAESHKAVDAIKVQQKHSHVVAYPMTSENEQVDTERRRASTPVSDPPGIVSRRRAPSKDRRETKKKSHGRRNQCSERADAKDSVLDTSEQRMEQGVHCSPSNEKVQTAEASATGSTRRSGRSRGKTSNLVSMWKEKEKRNSAKLWT